MDHRPRILVVEDDLRLAAMLDGLLREEGYDVALAHNGQQALHFGLTREFDVLLIDRGLPVMEGLEVLTRLRRKGVLAPALVLSALANPMDKVEGLDRGAEDYLAKPFDIDELLARLRAVLRRSTATVSVLRIPGGRLDVSGRSVTLDSGAVLVLSEREGDLLEHFARRPTQIFPRDDLLLSVFPDATDEGVVDTYVHYLRRKLGRDVVLTVRGIGYRLGATG
ncbi:response regulator transcription factor [Arthrobacter sp. I2-34]|uniref:Response regulator transcription factor n=1 Tax=Arthrobacter hankyongi TaxID=2904801 RepID=A0ABS9LD37_9MICC|nr:response regulator transcription factor [Arthrobacter hankyongi]MCG2624575.1 response regulator transcription factor [Arthrobacter hankyongi]